MWRLLALVKRTHLISQLSRSLSKNDRLISFVGSQERALATLAAESHHLMLLDDELLEDDLAEFAESVRHSGGETMPILVLTSYRRGHTRIDLAGLKRLTFIKKPVNRKLLRNSVAGLLDQVRYPNQINYLRHREKYIYQFSNIIFASPNMKSVLYQVRKVAASHSSVLITGASGTGKELIAAAIHYNSPRKKENFVAINCAALSEEDLNDELFGHEPGPVSGADERRIGRIEQANAGTLLLKRIDTLSSTGQAKVLRVVQQKEFERLGGAQKVKVDVRMICSAEKDLIEQIKQGEFREDLFYRVNVINIHLPPLGERKEDIPALAQFFLHKYRNERGKKEVDFSPKTIQMMMEYDWPGNIDELENVVERALYICEGSTVQPHHLSLSPGTDTEKTDFIDVENLNLDQIERAAIVEAMERTHGVQKEAARLLGVSPRVIHYKLQKYNIGK